MDEYSSKLSQVGKPIKLNDHGAMEYIVLAYSFCKAGRKHRDLKEPFYRKVVLTGQRVGS